MYPVMCMCRLATATKEDIEYFECQDEMAADLMEQHKQVERVIGMITLQSFLLAILYYYTSII